MKDEKATYSKFRKEIISKITKKGHDKDYCQICGMTIATTQSELCPGCPKASK